MAFQGIVTGFTPNDGQGDTLLAGAIKTNNNFRELYEALGDGTSIGIATLTQLKLSGILTATSLDVPDINLSGILTAGTLSAANVQVSGVVTANSFSGDFTGGTVVANALNVLGNVSIGGTLTYEDVTNVDSIGLITARNGVQVDSGGIDVTGISTFQSDVTFGEVVRLGDYTNGLGNLRLGDDGDLSFRHNGSNSYIRNATGSLYISAEQDNERVHIRSDDGSGGLADYFAAYGNSGEAILYHYGNQKLATKSNGIDVTGHTETDTLNVSGITSFQGNVSFTSTAQFDDNVQLRFGNNAELKVRGSGTDQYVQISTGNLYVINDAEDKNIQINSDNGSGGTATYFRAHGSTGEVQLYHYGSEKFATKSYGIDVTGRTETDTLNVSGISTFAGVTVSGVSTFSGDVNIPDSIKLNVGTGSDFQFYHDGVDSRIENATGDIKFKNSGSYYFFDETGAETIASFINDGQVNLFYNNVKRIETTGYGASVFGSLGVGTDPGSHALAVLGDARIIGILTVGESSVTIDGTSNELSVGTGVTLSHSNGIYVGDTRVHSTGFDIGSSSIHSTGATFGTFSVGIFTATVLKSTGIATFQNRIEGPGNFRVKESTGYVGINTVLPQNSLDVRGGVHIGGGDQIIIDGQDIYRQNATLNLRNQQATGGSEVQIRYQHGLSLKGGTDGTGGIELDAGRGFVKSPNGDFVIGSASTTGTVDQKLQVTGGAYVSGAMGIGSVSPERKLDVMGDLKVTENAKVGGIITATSFVGDGSGLTGVIPAASAGIGFKEEGVVVGTATTINFVGVGVTATVSNGVATIDISNDPGEVSIPGISTTGQTNLSEVDISGTVNMGGNLDIVGVTTVQGGLKVSGVTTFSNNVHFPDNTPIQFGTGQDLQIYHDGSNAYINNSTGRLRIQTPGPHGVDFRKNVSELIAQFTPDGPVRLFHDAVQKFETTGYGVTISGGIFAAGIVTATQFIGDGSGLTGVTAAGSGVEIQNNGSSVGTAATINFASNVTASVTDGVATINATGGGGGGGGISEGLAIAYAIAL
jgi:hypothetical protein